MFKYRNASTRTLLIRRLGITVKPGDEFESPHEINDATFERVVKPASDKEG